MSINHKIMKKIEISDEEIHEQMDFDKLLTTHRAITKNPFSQQLKWGIAITTLAVAIIIYFAFNKRESNKIINSKNVVDISKPSAAKTLVAQDSPQIQVEQKKKPIKIEPIKRQLSKPKSVETETEKRIADIYLEPEPVLGYPHLYEYFNTNLRYPQEALKDSVQGISTITLIISPNGKPDQLKITQSLGKAFDSEALRLIAGMPDWKAATLNGRPVASKISLPLTFKIEVLKK